MNEPAQTICELKTNDTCDQTEESLSCCGSECSGTTASEAESNESENTEPLKTGEEEPVGPRKAAQLGRNDCSTHLLTLPVMLSAIAVIYFIIPLVPTSSLRFGSNTEKTTTASATR